MDELNLIKNPRFTLGKRTPRLWRWCADGEARWGHQPSPNGRAGRVMLIEAERPDQSAVWSQTIPCRRNQHYRIEADIECDCGGADEESGVVLSVQCHGDEGPMGEPLRFAPVQRASKRLTLRGYFKTAPEARRVEIRVGLVRARGWARVYDVRLMKNLELDACSHVLAVPPPVYAEEPPRPVRRVLICGDAGSRPSLNEMLRSRFGPANVKHRPIAESHAQSVRADAILIPGDKPPSGVRTIEQLEELARNRIAVISIDAFARLCKTRLETKTVEQQDDPMHAKITCGCFITAGFALHDVFPFAGVGDVPSSFRQRQFVTNRAFHDVRKRYRFEVFLTAVTDNDQTTDKPIGLFKRTAHGAVVVCDLDALEMRHTTLGEANAAAVVLLNVLGCAPSALGQYLSPPWDERDFRQELIEFQTRYPAYTCLGLDHSETSVDGAVVRLGHDDESYGLPLPQRPAVVIRTGLRRGDEDGIYGTMLWLKRLVRPSPFPGVYTRYLTRRLRVFWLPLQRPWNDAVGLYRADGPPREARGEFDPGALRVLIDVTTGSQNRLRIVVDRRGALLKRCARALPTLARAMDPGRFIVYAPESGSATHDFDRWAWRSLDMVPEVVVDETSFPDRLHRSARAAGADLVRLELPRPATALPADSIRRTDLAACTLEHVVGQVCDAFVMNHLGRPLELDATDVLGGSCSEYRLVSADPRTGEEHAELCQVKSAPVIHLQPGTAVCK